MFNLIRFTVIQGQLMPPKHIEAVAGYPGQCLAGKARSRSISRSFSACLQVLRRLESKEVCDFVVGRVQNDEVGHVTDAGQICKGAQQAGREGKTLKCESLGGRIVTLVGISHL